MFHRLSTYHSTRASCVRGIGCSNFRNSRHRCRFSSARSSNSSFFTWYSHQLETRPFLTKGLTSGFIAGMGDFLCQFLSSQGPELAQSNNEEKRQLSHSSSVWDFFFVHENGWDIPRTIRFFVIGTFWVAPVTHLWYRTLSTRLFPGPSTPIRVTKRVALDQFGFGPIFTTSFMSWLWIMEGKDDIVRQLRVALPDMIVAGWTLWIPAMSINFSIVPIKYQVLFSNVVALVWNVYLSYKSSIDHVVEAEKQQESNEALK